MKLIITTSSADIDGRVDSRFGRAAYFVMVNTDTLEWQALPNPAVNASGGAGIKAAQFVVEQDCDAVVSGDFGPNAYNALKTGNVPVFFLGSCNTPREVIQHFKSGQLDPLVLPSEDRSRGRRN